MRLDYFGGLQTIFYNLNLLTTTASQLPKPRFIQITQTTVSNEIHARPAISGDGSFVAYYRKKVKDSVICLSDGRMVRRRRKWFCRNSSFHGCTVSRLAAIESCSSDVLLRLPALRGLTLPAISM